MAVKKFGAFMRLSMNDGVTRPAKRAEKSLRGVNKAAIGATGGIQAFNQRMKSMRRRGMGNMLRGAMILAPGVMLAKSAMTWEKGLAKISTMTDGGIAEIRKKLSTPLMNIASDIGVDLDKISEATYQALSAGIPEDKVLGFVRKASKLAVGGHTDVITSVDALSSSMNAWGVSTERAMEILSFGQKFGKTNVGKIGQSIGQVSKLADSLGVSMQETTASIAGLTKVGLKTPQATTAVKGMLTALVKQTPKALKITEKLGFAFNKETIQAKGLMGTLHGLVQAINASTNSEAERSQLLAGVIGRVRGLNAVLNLTSKDGMSTYNKFIEESSTKTGEAQRNYDKMSKTQIHQWKKLKIQLKKFSIVAGQALLPVLKVVGKQLGNILKPMMSWIQKNPVWTKRIMIAVGAVGALSFALGALQTVIGNVGLALTGIMAHPAIAALVATAAALGAIYKYADMSSEGGKAVGKTLNKAQLKKEAIETGKIKVSNKKEALAELDKKIKNLSFERSRRGVFTASSPYAEQSKLLPYQFAKEQIASGRGDPEEYKKEIEAYNLSPRTAFGEFAKQLKDLKKQPQKTETTVNYSPNITVNTTGPQTGEDIKRITNDDFKNKMQILKKNQQRTEL